MSSHTVTLFGRTCVASTQLFWHCRKLSLFWQRTNGSLVHVVYAYGRFRADMGHVADLAAQVDKRWRATEQPLFLLVCALDKQYVDDFRERCQASTVVTGPRLSLVAVDYYRRFIGDDSEGVADDFLDWWEKKVREEIVYRGDRLWKVVADHQNPDMRKLARLASHVCSLPAHTTDCERLFSDYGNVKTPSRNRLQNKKMQLLTQIKHDVRDRKRRQQDHEGRKRRRILSAEPYKEKSSSSSGGVAAASSSSSSGPQPVSFEPLSEADDVEVEFVHEVVCEESTNDGAPAEGWALRFRAIDELAHEADVEEEWESPSDSSFIEEATTWVHTTGEDHRLANALPLVNVRNNPQDTLEGVRAWKVALEALFPPGAQVPPTDGLMVAVNPFLV
eukprot:GHVU01086809.1.p1 GENE.GHVU01086809.1~~GHVU01086809.1.p1  ORF type:complete len:390 (-),score=61.10 GHVU01086809.1:1140-2309(-)